MAITFPRDMPDELGPIVGLAFDPEPMEEINPLRSGDIISLNLGPTLWRGKWEIDGLTPDKLGIVRAWYDTILSQESFYGYDRLREYPLAYAYGQGWDDLEVGGNPFDGTGVLVTVTDSKEITVNDLPVGFILSVGDYLAFDYGLIAAPRRALHRVVAADTADGAGALTVEVRPHVRVGWNTTPAPTVQFYRPAAKMKILPKSWSNTVRGGPFGRVSFDAIQTEA